MTRQRGDRGQAAVELALVTPVLLMMLLGIVQVLVVIRAQVAVTHAAREGARAAAVAADPVGAARAAALDSVALTDLTVSTSGRSGRVRTVVRARVPTDIPLIGALVGDITVQASATMAVEP